MDEKPVNASRPRRTIVTLRLNTEEAMQGRTWLLLPEGSREQSCGLEYPLPSRREDLQILSAIPVPFGKLDAGALYIRRAIQALRTNLLRKQSALVDASRRENQIQGAQSKLLKTFKEARLQAQEALNQVKREAEKAVASLNDLFSLGREGIEGQMKAHLAGAEWQGEKVTGKDFRDCFRMVLQGVKGLGLPSEQRTYATEAVIQELAASLEDTRDTIALAPGPPDGKEQ